MTPPPAASSSDSASSRLLVSPRPKLEEIWAASTDFGTGPCSKYKDLTSRMTCLVDASPTATLMRLVLPTLLGPRTRTMG